MRSVAKVKTIQLLNSPSRATCPALSMPAARCSILRREEYNSGLMPLTAGTKLGPYEIQAALGTGGMGEVYRARDTRLDRQVAIKVLAADLSSSAELKQRLEREARAISSLNHPHICQLYDIGSQNGTDYLVMELLEGETVAERLRKSSLPLSEVLRIGSEVADALEFAHRA